MVNGGIALAPCSASYERTLNADAADDGALGDATLRVPETGNGVPDILDEARWELEWMLRMQVPAGQPYAGMATTRSHDVDWTGLPLDPPDDPQPREPAPAVDRGHAQPGRRPRRRAPASSSPYDAEFAAELLDGRPHRLRGRAGAPRPATPRPDADGPNPGGGPYDDDDVSDEFYWAAAELF